MIRRRLLGKCEERHWQYQDRRCLLGHQHDGDHHFGWLRMGNLTLSLDEPPIKPVASPPTQPATPPDPAVLNLRLENENGVLATNTPVTMEQAERLIRAWTAE